MARPGILVRALARLLRPVVEAAVVEIERARAPRRRTRQEPRGMTQIPIIDPRALKGIPYPVWSKLKTREEVAAWRAANQGGV